MSVQIPNNTEFYKQEGEILPFTCISWVKVSVDLDDKFFETDFKHLYGFFQDGYAWGYWDADTFQEVARDTYKKFGEKQRIDIIFEKYKESASQIEQKFREHSLDSISSLSQNELLLFFKKLRAEYHSFWQTSLSIDAFDAGYDQEKIDEVANKYDFSNQEVQTLITPRQLTFKNRRLLSMLKIVKSYKEQDDHETVEEFCEGSSEVRDYMKKFDYHKSSYANVEHITKEEVIDEIEKYLEKSDQAKERLQELRSHSEEQRKSEERVLKKYDLETNPLYFFQKLTFWRENRKKVNLMGIHLLHYVLSALEKKTGINYDYLSYLMHEEVEGVLEGEVNTATLKRRREEGFFVAVTQEGISHMVGEKAQNLNRDFQELIKEDDADILEGTSASPGRASGKTRIVMSQDQFDSFNEGDILVTGMTRPEFVPLMKKAAAIVTDEGGITSHAAIVSREISTPCVIGTQNATQVLEDGDKVEVDAEEGVVKLID